MTISVEEALKQVPVTRIVHFTPFINLPGIFRDGRIRPSDDLAAHSDNYSFTDELRLDARPEGICCSFEYPNAYYWDQARVKIALENYPDWGCFVLDRDLVTRPGTQFSPCNAATARGAYLAEGGHALLHCWESPSVPRGLPRRSSHHPAVPTDLQAEISIPGEIDLSRVSSIVTQSEEQARSAFGYLTDQGLRPERIEWKYAPVFYSPLALRNAIWNSSPIVETTWTPANKGSTS